MCSHVIECLRTQLKRSFPNDLLETLICSLNSVFLLMKIFQVCSCKILQTIAYHKKKTEQLRFFPKYNFKFKTINNFLAEVSINYIIYIFV